MQKNKRYNTNDYYGETFYQLPKVLFTNKKYKAISNDAKVAYALLKDRFSYSVRNNWIDEENNIYFIFTNSQLMKMLNIHEGKLNKVKKELIQCELLEQKRMGMNQPNHSYLLRPEVEATDVYSQVNTKTLDNSGHAQIAYPESLDNSGHAQIAYPVTATNQNAETLDNSGHAQIAYNQYNTNYLDTNRYNIDTAELDFSTENYSKTEIQKQNQDLIKHAKDYLSSINKAGDKENGFGGLALTDTTIWLISLWAKTPKQMHKFIGIILNAKKGVEKELRNQGFSSYYTFLDDNEELQSEIENTIRRYFNALRNEDKHIKNYENYLFITMRNMFEQYVVNELARENKEKHPDENEEERNQRLLSGLVSKAGNHD